MKKIFCLFLFISSIIFAQAPEKLFSDANALYKESKYEEAIKLYEEVISNNFVSSELHYNLGNCYYKLNKVGPSIYNYEKAIQLNPSNKDAKNNLVFAKRLSLDRIEEVPKSFLQKFNRNYISKLSYESWAIVCIIFSFLGAILLLLYFFTISSTGKRLFFTTSIFSFILLLVSFFLALNQYSKKENTLEAIVYATEVSVKNEPTKNAEEAFIIHEGTKVLVLDSVDDWKKIQLLDGKIGWLKINEINLFNKF